MTTPAISPAPLAAEKEKMSDITEQDQLLLVNALLPNGVGQLFKQKVVHTCLHVMGTSLAVGSDLGILWIIDMSNRKLIREISEAKVPLTSIRLHSSHTLVATGSDDGLVTIVNYQKPSMRQVTREKDQHSVTTMEWSQDGGQLLVGYKSGKILLFTVHFDKALSIDSSILTDCGSEIVQLSQRNQLLLVSTVTKPILLDMTTGQLIQVGSRDRKPGSYGGTFTNLSGSLVIARPGLRLWIANETGKVQSTAKFKDVFVTSSPPPMPLYGGIATVTTPNESWQFSRLHSWSDEWVVGYHGNTTWVLEPHTLTCKGVITLGQHVVDFTTHGRDLYLLLSGYQRPILKLSLPGLPKLHVTITCPVEEEIKDDKTIVEKENNSEKDRNDDKAKIDDCSSKVEVQHKGLQDEERQHEEIQQKEEKQSEILLDEIQSLLKNEVNIENNENNKNREEISLEEENIQMQENIANQQVSTDKEDQEERKEEELNLLDSSHSIDNTEPPTIVIQSEERKDEKSEEGTTKSEEGTTKSEEEKNEKSEGGGEEEHHGGSRRVLEVVGTGFADLKGKLEGKLSQPLNKLTVIKKHHQEPTAQDEEPNEPVVTVAPLSSHEVARRAMMHKVNDEDDVVVHTATRKTRKGKKKTHRRKNRLTPASSTHSSMDNLDQIVDDLEQTSSLEQLLAVEGKRDEESVSPINIPVDENTLMTISDTKGKSLITADTIIHPHVTNNDMIEPLLIKDTSTDLLIAKDTIVDPHIRDSPVDLFLDRISPPVTVDMVPSDGQHVLPLMDSSCKEKKVNSYIEREASPIPIPNNTDTNLVPPKMNSLIATPPTGIRGRAHAFNIDSDDTLFSPDTVEEVLLWEQPGNTTPVISTKGSHPVRMITEDTTVNRDQPEGGRGSHSQSVSSSYSLEDAFNHPLGGGGQSDSDTDPEDKATPYRSRGANDSIVADDYYSLVGQLVGDSHQSSSSSLTPADATLTRANRSRADAYLPNIRDINEEEPLALQQSNNSGDISEAHSADIWCPVPQPSSNNVQSLCMSRSSLWLVDQRRTVYWSNPHTGGRDWQILKKHMSRISTSSDGKIVWATYHQQAFARYGICDICPAGSEWKNVSRSKSMPIKSIACDNTTVWAITTDGKVLHRKGVSSGKPEGTVWTEVQKSHQFVQISCCNDIVWAIDQSGQAFVREGITQSDLMGKTWNSVKSPSFTSIAVVDTGVVWGISTNNKLWFHCGATPFEPGGAGPWWEVSVSTLGKLSGSQSDSVWKVMSFERSRSFLQSVASRVTPTTQQTLMIITACSQSGVCMLTNDNQLHACWRLASGYHYESICDDGLFNISIWTKVTASNEGVWLVRDDGELYCVTSVNRSERVECQGVVDVLASSPSAIWVLCKGQIWSRQGITSLSPQGISWEFIELGSHMLEFIIHLAIGTNVAWAVDYKGHVHFRFGIHPREPGTGMSPAWVDVTDPLTEEYNFKSIAVSAEDWLVWAVDDENVTYVRKGVTNDFPVGRAWERITGELVRRITVSNNRVFALTPSGEVLCRQGITQKNPAGNYWRRLPGVFEEISSNPLSELWLIDSRGSVKKQRGKVVSACPLEKEREKAELEQGVTVEDWEVL